VFEPRLSIALTHCRRQR